MKSSLRLRMRSTRRSRRPSRRSKHHPLHAATLIHPLNRNKLLRSIKEKSEADISEFKAAKEAEYQRDYAALKHKIENEKGGEASKEQVDMKVIEEDYAQNRDSVVELLVRNVLSVNIEIPKVVKGAF